MSKQLKTGKIAGSTGLDNKHSPDQVGLGGQTVSVNVDISDSGKPRRRPGWDVVLPIPGHSLWRNPTTHEMFYAANTGQVFHFNPDIPDLFQLGTARAGEDIYWEDINGMTAWSDGTALNVVSDLVNTVHNRDGTYVRSEVELSPRQEREYYPSFPGAIHLCYYAGRLFGYHPGDDCIYHSLANRPFECDMQADFFRMSGVTMIVPVSDGLYIGDGSGVWFARFRNPKQADVSRVSEFRPIPGSGIKVDGRSFGQTQTMAVVWESEKGKVMGLPGGQVTYMTDRRVACRPGDRAASVVRNYRGETHHISLIRNPDQPTGLIRPIDVVTHRATPGGGLTQGFSATDHAEIEVIPWGD